MTFWRSLIWPHWPLRGQNFKVSFLASWLSLLGDFWVEDFKTTFALGYDLSEVTYLTSIFQIVIFSFMGVLFGPGFSKIITVLDHNLSNVTHLFDLNDLWKDKISICQFLLIGSRISKKTSERSKIRCVNFCFLAVYNLFFGHKMVNTCSRVYMNLIIRDQGIRKWHWVFYDDLSDANPTCERSSNLKSSIIKSCLIQIVHIKGFSQRLGRQGI